MVAVPFLFPTTMSDQSSNMPSRPSHSKRHASFNSPREVPLPSPTISLSESTSPFFLSPDQQDVQPAATIAQPRLPLAQGEGEVVYSLAQEGLLRAQKRSQPPEAAVVAAPTSDSTQEQPTAPQVSSNARGPEPSTVFPARPSSLADTHSANYTTTLTSLLRQQDPMGIPEASHAATAWLDRYSSSSLPLPSQIPFHTLSNPPQRPSKTRPAFSTPSSNSGAESPPPSPQVSPLPSPSSHCPPIDAENASSSSSSSSSSNSANSVSTTISSFNNTEPSADKQSNTLLSPQISPMTQAESRPGPRPISPFRAPQPPPFQPRAPALSEGTAMRRFMTASQLQSMSMNSALSSAPLTSSPAISSSMSAMSDSSYPPPDPPTILPVDPTHDVTLYQSDSRQAPYMPFLSHVLPSPDSSWIEVETTQSEYKLLVRLPGFSREGITLATKRRRILHIVADSWENEGGQSSCFAT